jgi:hypothetical protein
MRGREERLDVRRDGTTENGSKTFSKNIGRASADEQLEALVEKRHALCRDDDEEHNPAWQKSVHRHAEKIREARRVEWATHLERLAVLHENLAKEHRQRAANLRGEAGG